MVDLAGRSVAVPARIDHIATVGALPAALQKPDFKYQAMFAPELASSPTIEGTIGQVNVESLDDPQRAQTYLDYFDATTARVTADLSGVTPADRPGVLYLQLPNLSQPSVISEWWIAQAGRSSVTTTSTSSSAGIR